jgi:hypothetical protein
LSITGFERVSDAVENIMTLAGDLRAHRVCRRTAAVSSNNMFDEGPYRPLNFASERVQAELSGYSHGLSPN